MAQYINKAALVAEIERRISVLKANESVISMLAGGMFVNEFKDLLSFLDTLEVKEIHEDIDMDLNPLFEEMGVEPDSRIALMFKNAFYKSVDNYLDKKEDKL